MNLPSFADINDFVRPELRRVEALIARRDLAEAARALTALGRSAPRDWRVSLIGIQLAENAGNSDAARASAKRCYEMAPEAPLAQIEWSRILSRDGEHASAVAIARRAVTAAADDDGLILPRGVAIATAAKDWQLVNECLQKAHRAQPQDLTVVRTLGFNALCRGELDEGIAWYEQCLQADGHDELALSGKSWALLQKGELAAAARGYAVLVQQHPGSAEYDYFRALSSGETPSAMPSSLALRAVEGYAARFDEWVAGTLGYDAPRRVAEIIRAAYPRNNGAVLDLGCGTGMLAACLGPLQASIVGVDISKTMLDQASKRHYDRLHHCDMRDALRDTPELQYEVIAVCDALIYIGACDEIVREAARILRPNGLFVATFEQSDKRTLVLRPTQRYAHSESYVRDVFAAAQLSEVEIEPIALRHEAGVPINGFIAYARKRRPAAASSAGAQAKR